MRVCGLFSITLLCEFKNLNFLDPPPSGFVHASYFEIQQQQKTNQTFFEEWIMMTILMNWKKKTLNFFSNCKENFYVLYEIDCKKKSIKKSTPYQARTIVSLDIFFTYGHKTPESLLCRHMHQQYSSYRGHGLAVAISWVVNGVGLQNFVQVFLTIKYHREQILG